jgi:uncharacterized protein GlcG (DUF336 family)
MPYSVTEMDVTIVDDDAQQLAVRRAHYSVPHRHERTIYRKRTLISIEHLRTLTRTEAGALIADLGAILVPATGPTVDVEIHVVGIGVITRLEIAGLIGQLASALVH